MRATVITIRTALKPENKTYDHDIVIAGNLARSTGEHDTWRLFDTKAKTVTFVDDIAKTIRTRPLAEILREYDEMRAHPLPAHFPRAKYVRTNDRVVIELGVYRRELRFAEHPAIPKGLFAMMHASETPTSPLAPMMRAVEQALAAETRFPFADRTTVPVAKGDMVVERTVTGIAQRNVPQSLLTLPKGYQVKP